MTSDAFDVQISDSEDDITVKQPRRGQASKPKQTKSSAKRVEKVAKKAKHVPKAKPPKEKDILVKKPRGISKKAIKKGSRASAASILECAAKLRKAVDETWAVAPKADMNQKPCQKDASKTRGLYLIRRHAFKVAAAGAATYTVQCLREASKTFNIPGPVEKSNHPWLPSFTPGAQMQLAYFMAAYSQSGLLYASIARKESTGRSRINHDLMNIGFEHADRTLFEGSNFGQSRTAATYFGEYKADADKLRKVAALKRVNKKMVSAA